MNEVEQEIYDELVKDFTKQGRQIDDAEFREIFNDQVDRAYAPPLCPVCDGLSPDNSECLCDKE
jgi:hypothetical protein